MEATSDNLKEFKQKYALMYDMYMKYVVLLNDAFIQTENSPSAYFPEIFDDMTRDLFVSINRVHAMLDKSGRDFINHIKEIVTLMLADITETNIYVIDNEIGTPQAIILKNKRLICMLFRYLIESIRLIMYVTDKLQSKDDVAKSLLEKIKISEGSTISTLSAIIDEYITTSLTDAAKADALIADTYLWVDCSRPHELVSTLNKDVNVHAITKQKKHAIYRTNPAKVIRKYTKLDEPTYNSRLETRLTFQYFIKDFFQLFTTNETLLTSINTNKKQAFDALSKTMKASIDMCKSDLKPNTLNYTPTDSEYSCDHNTALSVALFQTDADVKKFIDENKVRISMARSYAPFQSNLISLQSHHNKLFIFHPNPFAIIDESRDDNVDTFKNNIKENVTKRLRNSLLEINTFNAYNALLLILKGDDDTLKYDVETKYFKEVIRRIFSPENTTNKNYQLKLYWPSSDKLDTAEIETHWQKLALPDARPVTRSSVESLDIIADAALAFQNTKTNTTASKK